jgi:glutamate racemase
MKYAAQDARFLLSRNVRAILIACGTVSTVALNALKISLPVPVFGVVSAASREAADVTKNGKIGVMGTGATISSGVFEHELKLINGSLEVTSVACPLLVPVVEYGFADDEIAYLSVKRYLQPIIDAGADTVILGCTHFPILIKMLKKAAPHIGAACGIFHHERRLGIFGIHPRPRRHRQTLPRKDSRTEKAV